MFSLFRRFKSPKSKPQPPAPQPTVALERGNVQSFRREFERNLAACPWQPHPRYSVFTQYDQSFYLAHQAEFEHKYRCFYAVAKTIAPRVIIELGTHAGSSADAYMSAAPAAKYYGLDLFGEATREDDGAPWKPYDVALALFAERGFSNFELIRVDLRSLQTLPQRADFVVVDGAHDFDNEYADLQLALSAQPQFIFVDDSDGLEAFRAIEKFMAEDIANRLEWACPILYAGGGLVLKLKAKANA